jgi:hypothetical protein
MPTATKNINAEKIQGNLSVTSVTGSFTGSLIGIASTASFVTPLNQNVLITGSTQITGSLGVTGSIYSNNTIGASYAGYFKNNSYNVGGNAPLIVDDGNAGGAFSIGYGGTSAFMYFPPYFGNNSIYLHGSGYYGVYFEGLSSYDGVTSFVAPGRVKIGNNTLPSSKLHVVGAGSTSATTAFLTQNSSGTDLLKVTDDGATTIVGNTTITGSLTVSSSNATQFLVGSNLAFVSSGGDVGIGTTSPSSYLGGTNGIAIRQPVYAGISLGTTSAGVNSNWLIYKMYNGQLSIYETTAARDRFNISYGGQVGIGSGATTAAQLVVQGAGSTSATSTLQVINASSAKTIECKDNQSIGFFGAATVTQPTTAGASSTFTSNPGVALNDADTYDGYTIAQVVKALRQLGLLA